LALRILGVWNMLGNMLRMTRFQILTNHFANSRSDILLRLIAFPKNAAISSLSWKQDNNHFHPSEHSWPLKR